MRGRASGCMLPRRMLRGELNARVDLHDLIHLGIPNCTLRQQIEIPGAELGTLCSKTQPFFGLCKSGECAFELLGVTAQGCLRSTLPRSVPEHHDHALYLRI